MKRRNRGVSEKGDKTEREREQDGIERKAHEKV